MGFGPNISTIRKDIKVLTISLFAALLGAIKSERMKRQVLLGRGGLKAPGLFKMMLPVKTRLFGALFFTMVLLVMLAVCQPSFAVPLDEWNWRNPLPTSNYIYEVAYGNGTFVAVGDCGTIITSPDGATWTNRSFPTDKFLYGVCYGNGVFVAVGEAGTVLTSPGGATWTSRTSGTSQSLNGVCYGNGTFVAVGHFRLKLVYRTEKSIRWKPACHSERIGKGTIQFFRSCFNNSVQ
jgi:hypothetical protein